MSESTRAERAKREVQESEQAPAQQITDFSSLDLTPVNINRYVVTNRSSGTVHTVNLNDRSCTCEDQEYNQGPNGACKHILYAVYHAPRTRDMSEEVLRDASMLFTEARDAVGGGNASSDPPKATDADTDASHASDKPPANPEHDREQAQAEAEAAADELQAAYDELIDDMQVRARNGLVWIQTGRDTPDEWPHPGGGETWEVLIGNPEQPMYIHEEHGHYGDKPGEWWKNALYPSDVDAYIDEVLA